WNKIVKALDEALLTRPQSQSIQPRYYAAEQNRGQRKETNKAKARDIPVSVLHRCHLKKEWYDRLSQSQREALKPSPKGWNVTDEEANSEMEDA
ncbi:hypothetical protein FRC07_013256, partial [Ceratobasidium sp. 392]